jgi:hemolysin activation/secretion protein
LRRRYQLLGHQAVNERGFSAVYDVALNALFSDRLIGLTGQGHFTITMFKSAIFLASLIASAASAQSGRDAAATLGRDLATQAVPTDARTVAMPVVTEAAPVESNATAGLFVGAVNVDGARDIPRAMFAPVIERFIGKQAGAPELQAMARAVANAAREQGYLFASAMVPEQVVDAGTVTVRLDAGAVDRVRIVGSRNVRLRQTLDKVRGRAVRKDVLERQLLLAGDIPGVTIVSTRYVREADGATLIVEVAEDRVAGSVGLDNYGSQDLGPARLRLRLDLTGLLDDGDQLTTQLVVTPLQPKELAYGSLRYSIGIGSATRVGVAAAVGKTKPGGSFFAGRVTGESRYGAIFVNHALLRSNRTSLWVNAELAWLRVDQKFDGDPAQRDDIATLTLSTTATTKFAGGRLWGGLGVVQGLGPTKAGDPIASRLDGSAAFTKGVLWVDWTGNVSKMLSVRVAANGQIASRPLLAAQEIGVGGPGFGRGYDFSERFGDDGVLGLIELREAIEKPVSGVDWVQLYQFVDGGYVENKAGGFGDGARWSAGAGLRAAFGKTSIGVEAAFPINAPRYETGSKAPRVNLTVGQDF